MSSCERGSSTLPESQQSLPSSSVYPSSPIIEPALLQEDHINNSIPSELVILLSDTRKEVVKFPVTADFPQYAGDLKPIIERFYSWWKNTEWAQNPANKVSLRLWDRKETSSEIWQYCDEVALISGQPQVRCRHCHRCLGHPRHRRTGTSTLSAHLRSQKCGALSTEQTPTPKQSIKNWLDTGRVSVFISIQS